MIPIKILSQKPILQADLFSVVETTLDIKGKIVLHKNIYRPPIVSIFPLTGDGQIYLIKQYRYLHSETFLEEIAGHVESGEDPLDAAKRELQEEAGMTAGTWRQFGVFSGTSSVIKTAITLFTAGDLVLGEPSPEEDEEIEVVKMSLEEAVDCVLQGKIKNSVASLGIMMLGAMQKNGTL